MKYCGNCKVIFRAQRIFIRMNLQRLIDYESRIELTFKREAMDIPNDIPIDSEDEAERAWAERHLEEYNELTEFLPEILRRSSVISLVSVLEIECERLARMLGSKLEVVEEITSIKGQGVDRSRIYIKKYCKVDLSSLDKVWQKINNLIQVRNCIAHADGYVNRVKENKRSHLKQAINSNPKLCIDDRERLVVFPGYMQDECAVVEEYLLSSLALFSTSFRDSKS